MEKEKKERKFMKDLPFYLLGILLILSLMSSVIMYSIGVSTVSQDQPETKQETIAVTYVVDSTCDFCTDYAPLIAGLKSQGIPVLEKTVDYSSDEGKSIVNKYALTFAPTFIMSKEAADYPTVIEGWSQVGTVESDGSYVYRTKLAPYRSLSSGDIKGVTSIINLVDETCDECYNVSQHRDVLEIQYGLYIESESTYDVGSEEGKELIEKYNITLVPTVLVSPEASEYIALQGIWSQVGSIELDGWYVFREMGALRNATYMNLTSGKAMYGGE